MQYRILRSKRKSLALEITAEKELLVRAPLGLSDAAIRRFVKERRDWIEKQLRIMEERQAALPPPLTQEETKQLLERAKAELPARVAALAARMGLSPNGVSITHARTRFGSCSANDHLNFSCYLMANPEPLIDYVIVHELAHIRHKNHGKDFWCLVERFYPDYKNARKQLFMPRLETPR